MAYCTPQFTCGCGEAYPLHDFMKNKDAEISIACKKCGTLVEMTIHVPKDLLVCDAVQKADFERLHGKVNP